MTEVAIERRQVLELLAIGSLASVTATGAGAASRPPLMVIAEIIAKPQDADAIRNAMVPFAKAAVREPGCLGYKLFEDAGQAGRFLTYESWTDAAALDAHLGSPAMKAAGARLGAMLAQPVRITRLKPL